MSKKTITILTVLCFVVLCIVGKQYGDQNEETELTFGMFAGGQWDVPNDDCYKIIDEVITRFEKEHPTVHVKYVSGIQKEDYSDWISKQVLDDKIPDIMMVLSEDFELFSNRGVLKDLTTLMNNDEDFDSAQYYEGCFSAGTLGEKQFALPYESDPTLMFVNQTLLKENQLSVDRTRWTWNNFYTLCRMLTKDIDNDGQLDTFGVNDYSWIDAVYANGGNLFDIDKNTSKFTSPEVDESISFAKRISKLSGYQTPTSEDFDMGKVGFQTMKFSKFRTYKAYPYKLNKYNSFDWDFLSLPVSAVTKNQSYTDNLLMGISDKTQHEQLAWEFLKMLTYDVHTQQEIFRYSQGVPVLKEVMTSEETQELFDQLIGNESTFIIEDLNTIMEHSVPREKVDNYEEIMNYADGVITEIILKNEDIDDALLQLKKHVDLQLMR